MLIALPSSPATEKAAVFLAARGITHRVIPMPVELNYHNGADVAIYLAPADLPAGVDVAMLLTKEKFVVMRVFKSFILPEER
ncbi:MAG: hypothetical protein AB7P76_10880 [Candidatus Melainabacteria bacterium]